jgi:hypothetical protein
MCLERKAKRFFGKIGLAKLKLLFRFCKPPGVKILILPPDDIALLLASSAVVGVPANSLLFFT